MSNKIKPIVFFCLILTLLIVGIVFIILGNKSNRVLNLYDELFQNEEYTFSIEGQGENNQYKLVMLKQNSNFCIDMYNGEEYTSTLVKDEYIYYVMHKEQEYYTSINNGNETDLNIIENAFNEIKEKNYSKGKEEINGKMYYYEEYKDIPDFFMNITGNENDELKTRFYFEGNKIKYIKNMVSINEELLKVECNFETDENKFDIPSNYAER